jgi:hypothetical protein
MRAIKFGFFGVFVDGVVLINLMAFTSATESDEGKEYALISIFLSFIAGMISYGMLRSCEKNSVFSTPSITDNDPLCRTVTCDCVPGLSFDSYYDDNLLDCGINLNERANNSYCNSIASFFSNISSCFRNSTSNTTNPITDRDNLRLPRHIPRSRSTSEEQINIEQQHGEAKHVQEKGITNKRVHFEIGGEAGTDATSCTK